jgi:peptide/nickel transport system permease protein
LGKRDILSRLITARITLYIVALVALIAPIVGLMGTWGMSAGRMVLMRITDIFLAFHAWFRPGICG